MKIGHNIKIVHDSLGELVNETFAHPGQFKLFLKLIDGCLAHKENFDFFDGEHFLVHIPFRILNDSVILTKLNEVSTMDVVKSKIEALATL